MKSLNFKSLVPYLVMFVLFIPWCSVVYELSKKDIDQWLILSATFGGLYGWYLIYSIVKKYNTNN